MSFTASFGTVWKAHNSTLQGSHNLEVPVTLKEDCSVLNPSLLVDLTASQIFGDGTLNHCFISQFHRYYFVVNWTWERGLWRADCSVDVLATWRGAIGASRQYILRSSAESDGTVYDTMYPTKNAITDTYVSTGSPWTLTGGYYVVGIINKQGSQFGAVNYYGFTPGQFSALCDKLFGTDYLSSTEIEDITKDITLETWKSLYNPFQYIVSCVYIPCDISDKLQAATVYVGYWSMGLQAGQLVSVQPARVSLSLPWSGTHPDAARGDYVYCGPYTETDLDIQPFGHIQLPADLVYKNQGVLCQIEVDVITGLGTCFVGGRATPYTTLQCMVGVPIQMAQMSRDYLGTAATALSGITSTVGAALTEGPTGLKVLGAVSSAVSAIDSTVRAQVPRLSTLGSTGGFSALVALPVLVIRFRALVGDDPNRLGRPLCQEKTIADIPGYILCNNAKINTNGTDDENQKIVSLMNGGFLYE